MNSQLRMKMTLDTTRRLMQSIRSDILVMALAFTINVAMVAILFFVENPPTIVFVLFFASLLVLGLFIFIIYTATHDFRQVDERMQEEDAQRFDQQLEDIVDSKQ